MGQSSYSSSNECIMDGSCNNNLTEVIIVVLMKSRGLTREDMSKKNYVLVHMGLLFFRGETSVTM